MGSDGHRWQAAMGMVSATLVIDAVLDGADTWSPTGERGTAHAEGLLAGAPIPIDLAAEEAAAAAVGLSAGPPPLLVDTATVELIDHVRTWLTEPRQPTRFNDPTLALAADLARGTPDITTAVTTAAGDRRLATLAAAIAGLEGGIGAVPARLVSQTRGSDGRRGRRYASRLVDRLLGLQRTDWYDPRHRRGPRQVLPGLWLANIHGLRAFVGDHPAGLVVSLCDIEGRLDDHRDQITFHLDDTPKPDANPNLARVLDEVLGEVAAARAAGQPVLVHCRHGASRTGLVLRLILATELELDPDSALVEAQCLWPHTSTWNTAWAREIARRRAASASPTELDQPSS